MTEEKFEVQGYNDNNCHLNYETSRIRYIEPNYIFNTDGNVNSDDVRSGTTVEQAPLLEDYCIALDLEVELTERNYQVSLNDVVDRTSNVILMSWSNQKDHKTTSFMSGRKVYCDVAEKKIDLNSENGSYNSEKIKYDKDGNREYVRYDNFFTTDYTGAYYDDVIHHGTTECVGISSVNIKYDNFMVPQIDIKFVDVRGMSLFAPIQAQRNGEYNALHDKTVDEVAQSFFQCFFMQPYPKFRLRIKGYYGKPVCYEVQLSTFKASFNSESGNFEMNCHFLGYQYSFLSDISMPALFAAPYSDYFGQEYWQKQKENGRFKLVGKNSEIIDMPTLAELYENINMVYSEMALDEAFSEETKKQNENQAKSRRLRSILDTHTKVAKAFLDALKKIEAKDEIFNARVYQISEKDIEAYDKDQKLTEEVTQTPSEDKNGNIYVMTSSNKALEQWYSNLKSNNNIKNVIGEINSSIKGYSNDFSGSSLDETSGVTLDFDKLGESTPKHLITFDISTGDNTLKNINTYGNSPTTDAKILAAIISKKNHDSTSFGKNLVQNGNKCENTYIIEFPYISAINSELEIVSKNISDYNSEEQVQSRAEKESEELLANFPFFPSVENITKIIFAHFETLMWMMYSCVNDIETTQRKLNELGLSFTDNLGDYNESNYSQSALNDGDIYVGPFPRFTKQTIAEDGETPQYTDTWLADAVNQEDKFQEYQMVRGLFNGVDKVSKALSESEKVREDIENAIDASQKETFLNTNAQESVSSRFKWGYIYALTSIMDLFTTGHIFGEYDESADKTPQTDLGEFVRAISLRAFASLALPYNAKNRTDYAKEIGHADAYNFVAQFSQPNASLVKIINASITTDSMWGLVTNKNSMTDYSDKMPWDGELFSTKNSSDDFWLRQYKLPNNKGFRYPVQDFDPSKINNDTNLSNKYVTYCPNLENYLTKANTLSGGSQYQIVYFPDFYPIISLYKGMLEKSEFKSDELNKSFECVNYDYNNYDSWFLEDAISFSVIKLNGLSDKENGEGSSKKWKLGANSQYGFNDVVTIIEVCSSFQDTKTKKWKLHARTLSPYSEKYNKIKVEGIFGLKHKVVLKEDKSLARTFYLTNYSKFVNPDIKDEDYTQVDKILDKKYNVGNDKRIQEMFLINGIDIIDYSALKTVMKNKQPLMYMPILAVMQLGAIASCAFRYLKSNMFTNTGAFNLDEIELHIPLPCRYDKYKEHRKIIQDYFNGLSCQSIIHLANVFETEMRSFKLLDKYISAKKKELDLGLKLSADDINAGKFKKYKCIAPNFTNLLFQPYVVAKTSKYANRSYQNAKTAKLDGFTETTYKAYMNGFLTKLNELWGTHAKDQKQVEEDATKVTKTPDVTTKDMKLSLYQYLKLLYDKWIPNYDFCEWKMEKFFMGDNHDDTYGHTIHFIDSYYNRIGDKIPVNLQSIKNNIHNLLGENAYKSNMYNFFTQILQENQFMLLVVQNFLDLSSKKALWNMFKPLPYNQMGASKKSPDLVAIYSYKPSVNLALPNAQYKDDGFMLDGSNETLPLRTGEGYPIPAFGVAYGKQYQSYFTSIDVNIDKPEATETSLKTKFAIVGEAMKYNHKTANFVGQDLFTIYSENSYQCTVKMLGNAWVQPLMYFCLTNIPMFKGSYMIYHVEHTIEQGKMMTTFTGVRMARIASPINKQPLIGGGLGLSTSELERLNHENADVTNNCQYAVFNVYSEDVKGEDINDVLNKPVTNAYYRRTPAYNYSNVGEALTYCALNEMGPDAPKLSYYCFATVAYNTYLQNKKDLCDSNKFSAFKIPNPEKGEKSLKEQYKGKTKQIQMAHDAITEVFQNSPSCLVAHGFTTEYCKNPLVKNVAYVGGNRFTQGTNLNVPVRLEINDLNKITLFADQDEWNSKISRATKGSGYWPHKTGEIVFKQYKTIFIVDTSTVKKPLWGEASKPNTSKNQKNNGIVEGFMNALQKSMNSSNNAREDITYKYIGNSANSLTILITQTNKNTNHLGQTFDIILNGYYDYVSELRWCLENENNSFTVDNPKGIIVTLKNRDEVGKGTTVGMALYSDKQANDMIATELEYESAISVSYARSLFKCYESKSQDVYTKEVKTKVKDVFERVKITDCSEIISPHNGAKLVDDTYLGADKWNAGAAANFLINKAQPEYTKSKCGYCAAAVKSAIAVGGIPYISSCDGKDVATKYIENAHFVKLGSGNAFATDSTYKQLMNNPQIGDICSFIYGDNGHVAMYCGSGWYSDFKQTSAKGASDNCPWVYARYSSEGGAVSTKTPIMIKWDGSYKGNLFQYNG